MNIVYIILIITLFTTLIITFFILKSQQSRIEINLEEIRTLSHAIEEMRKSNDMMSDRFKVLANDSLDRNASYLKESTTSELEKLLSPLKIRIEDFNNIMQKSYTDASASRKSLSDQLEHLTRLNLTIGEDARNLSSALRGNNRIQGKWGETVLEKMLENAGFIRGINFDTQVTQNSEGSALHDESGSRLRPDIIIHLPQKREIVIDAKTSLSSYLEFCEADNSLKRQEATRKHVASIKRHIDELSAKNYSKSINNSLEQVLLFIPNDGALILATDADSNLIDYASERKVTLVSPSQLTGILMIVNQLWRRESQDRNAAEIARLGGLLYDSIVSFVKDMRSVEDYLKKAGNSYDSAFSRLTSGQRSIIARAERLKNLGSKTSRNLPSDIISSESDIAS